MLGRLIGAMVLLPNFYNGISLFPQLRTDKLRIVGVEAHKLHFRLWEIAQNEWRLSLSCIYHLQLLVLTQAILICLLERFCFQGSRT
mgnify:CR=1 FL=1